MKRLISTFKDLGFSLNETNIYFAVLELGETTVSDIAKHIDMPRTSCAEILHVLERKHLISFFVMKKKRYFVAEDPKRLIDFFKQRTATLEEVLPQLQAMHKKKAQKPGVRLYEGKEGLKTILAEVIAEQRNFDVIASVADSDKLLGEDISEYIEQRQKHHLRVRLITDRSKEARELQARDEKELRETRFVPAKYNFKSVNFIFGNKIALISLTAEHPIGLVLEDKALAGTFRMYFDLLWYSASRN